VDYLIYLLALGLITTIGAAFKWRSDARQSQVREAELEVRMVEIEAANKSTMQLSLDNALKSIIGLNGQLDAMRDRMAALDELHTAQRAEANQRAINQQSEIGELRDLVRDQAEQIQLLIIESEKTAAKGIAEAVAVNAKVESQAAEIARLKTSEAELRTLNAEKDKRIERLEAVIVERDKQLAALMKEQDARVASLEAIILSRDAALAALTTRVATLEGENNRLAREEKHWAEERQAWKLEREQWQKERTALIDEREALQVQIVEMRAELDALKKRGTGPLPSLDEVMDAQPEAGQEPSEVKDENGEDKPNGTQ